ncbi:MAG TPA: energy coupling factor transporter S component ThiW [Candidatus Anaerostipes avistercoris]|uniref:Energy coupling factor transporter S component ThiW n=1 Tax=Candidatus Anaerostipes avistercoris TaxID=2838462 RepID=A0A9D2PM86_9FIRM|nr:energy coupling factor transporter S component ThiW [Candidatus Anaerostipes avistercoris]
MNYNVRKLTVAAMLVAVSVVLSAFSIPIGASRCFPIQHLVNVISAVFLGPLYGVIMAFCTSLIRNLMGTGSLLAFPGSMAGAFLCGMVFSYTKRLIPTYFGEVIGTGIIGGMLCYPVATLLMGQEAALFTFVVPFLMSTVCGTIMAAVILGVLYRSKAVNVIRSTLRENE